MQPSVMHRAESLSVQQVLTFCRVYELGGYARAAEELGLAGPTMWEQVKTLEKIYRTQLFERTGRSIQPTETGRLLYDVLSPLLATIESTFEVIEEQDHTGAKQVRLVTGVRMMLEELGEPLRKFSNKYPDHRLKLMTADNRAAQEFVLNDRADIAILIEPPQEVIIPGIACEVLYPIQYLAAFPPRHKLARKTNFALSDLEHEPLVVGNPDTVGRRMLEQAWFRYGIKTRIGGNLSKHVATKVLSNELGLVNVVAAIKKGRKLTKALNDLLRLLHETLSIQ
jgi:DNA-binding transcriptional LysR family regulator